MTDIQRISLDEVVLHFAELEDPRSTVNRRHPLVSVVVIAVLAVLSGASGPTAIAEWAAAKEEFLIEALDLPNGVPRKDVFRRVLMALKPATFQACYANWLNSLRARAAAASGVERPVLAIDGKTVRRSHDRKNGLGALHSVSVWASEFGLSLGQVACAEKSNEITAIPEVLRLVDIKGAIITIDAMGAQKAIAADIIDGGGDFVLALKGNQGALHQTVIDHIDEKLEGELEGAQELVTTEKGHGRVETRTYLQLPAPKELPGFTLWKGLKTIAIVTSLCIRDGKETSEVRYYISSLAMGVKQLARAVRGHWGIENSCHWVLDVTYREDESRIREEWLRENMAWLNRFTLSLLKQHRDRKSIAMRRHCCGWNENYRKTLPNSFVQSLCLASSNTRLITLNGSGRIATSIQFDSFRVNAVGYGRPTWSCLLPRAVLHRVGDAAGGFAPGRGRLARQGRLLGAREPRVASAGRLLEESPS